MSQALKEAVKSEQASELHLAYHQIHREGYYYEVLIVKADREYCATRWDWQGHKGRLDFDPEIIRFLKSKDISKLTENLEQEGRKMLDNILAN